MLKDEIYLLRTFELAKLGRFTTSPNPNVGCVIVLNNKIVGEGYHKRAGYPHAEICALRMAGNYTHGSTVYINLEPCSHYGRTPPCTVALINAGVVRVVASVLDPNPKVAGQGLYDLQKSGIKVQHNLMIAQAEYINRGFFKRMRTGLPWTILKLAMSLDGRTAMKSGESKWLTSVQARQDVQILRAESDVILSSSVTVLKDNPMLNVRWSFLPHKIRKIYNPNYIRQPIKVIIDSANRLNPSYKIVQKNTGKTILARIQKDSYIWPSWVEQLIVPSINIDGRKQLHLMSLMQILADREVNIILVEAGSKLAGALLNANLIDELIIYQAPKLLGTDAKPLCSLPKVNCLNDVMSLRFVSIKQVGSDIRLKLKPK